MGVAAHRFDNGKRRRPDDHARQAMLTPGYVLEPVRQLLGGIGLDPCTEPDNPTRAEQFYHLPHDGCSLPWDAPSVFCNPPYGEAKDRWVARCIEEGERRKVVLLIPSHTETRTFQAALDACHSLVLVKARLRFGVLRENGRQEAASHGSAIFGFGVDVSPLSSLGTALVPIHVPAPSPIREPTMSDERRRTFADDYYRMVAHLYECDRPHRLATWHQATVARRRALPADQLAELERHVAIIEARIASDG